MPGSKTTFLQPFTTKADDRKQDIAHILIACRRFLMFLAAS